MTTSSYWPCCRRCADELERVEVLSAPAIVPARTSNVAMSAYKSGARRPPDAGPRPVSEIRNTTSTGITEPMTIAL